MAAAARPPGITDARVPCPVCGGLIHPVAGRCKHCKQDLTTYRGGRPAAAAALPALQATPGSGPVAQPSAPSGPHAVLSGNGHSGPTAAPSAPQAPTVITPSGPVPVAARVEPSQPILPPRTTMTGIPAQRSSSIWRSWPTLVIILAMLAIATAVVLMMWPTDHDRGKHALQPPDPAPERMNTDPLPAAPVPTPNDPWGGGGHSQVTPPQAPQLPQIDPIDPNAVDPYGATKPTFMELAMARMCTQLATCAGLDQQLVEMSCKPWGSAGNAQPSCAAGRQCLAKIASLDCNAASPTPLAMLTDLAPCAEALDDPSC